MKTPMKRSASLIISSMFLFFGACSDGVTGPDETGPSSLTFAYQGPISGSFAAEQDCQSAGSLVNQTCARGLRYQNPGAVELSGTRLRPGEIADQVYLMIPGQSTGTFAIDASTCPWWDDRCATVFVVLELLNVHGSQARYSCSLHSGTIRVTAASESRAIGEFSGTGVCADREMEADDPPFTITSGRFDVKLVRGTRG